MRISYSIVFLTATLFLVSPLFANDNDLRIYNDDGSKDLSISSRSDSSFDDIRRLRLEKIKPVEKIKSINMSEKYFVDSKPRAVRSQSSSHPKKIASQQGWTVVAGSDLRTTLNTWCARAGWNPPVWQSDFEYPIQSGVTFDGNFEESVRALITAMRDVRPTPTITLYTGNRTLVLSNNGRTQTD